MSLERLRSWLIDIALPTWAERGYDRSRRCFQERLDLAGQPLDVPHRAMVQARQIYVFAHAAELGWFPDGAGMATDAAATLDRCFVEDDAAHRSYRFSIDREGACVSAQKDSYTQAFVVLAHAWLFRLTGDARYLDLADRLLAFIDDILHDPTHDGLLEDWPTTRRGKRQNPHMHMLEALVALDQAAPGRGYAGRAKALACFVRDRMFDAGRGLLAEHFDAGWQTAGEMPVFEPGHHFEWAWLLAELNDLPKGGPRQEWGATLDKTAMAHGLASDGLVFDEVGFDLLPTKSSHRLWPHCEAIKAAAVRYRDGDGSARAFADRIAAILLDTFLDYPFAGGWIDHVRPDRRPLVDYVPASSLYHITLAVAVATRTFGLGAVNTREVMAAR